MTDEGLDENGSDENASSKRPPGLLVVIWTLAGKTATDWGSSKLGSKSSNEGLVGESSVITWVEAIVSDAWTTGKLS